MINYNNPTINMNFNDNNNAHPANAYEDHDFYEQLNYSKFSNNQPSQQPPVKKVVQATHPAMNAQTAAVMKTVPLQMNPYEDSAMAAKTAKNMPLSQQVSRQNSMGELDLEEISQEVAKKKVVKKKIIKKIIKKKNVDGTVAAP